MPSLRELQEGFVAAVLDGVGGASPIAITPSAHAAERIAIYRRAAFINYRNALRATYPVVARILGLERFDAAVDAFVRAHPSTCGDLNVYGAEFGAFLEDHPAGAERPFLADLARLEWAIDEASRAADVAIDPQSLLSALAAVESSRLPAVRLALHPSCRLIASRFPILRRWLSAQDNEEASETSSDEAGDAVLVRRDAQGVPLERLGAAEGVWLSALAQRATLGAALDAAIDVDATFKLQPMLAKHIAAGTISGLCND
jgi:hypothetical protein